MKKALSVPELEKLLGENIKTLRLQKNLGRQEVCEQAGISVSALRHLEAGQGATIKTLVCVLRVLDKQEWILSIAPKISINPLHMLKTNSTRQRASGKRKISCGY